MALRIVELFGYSPRDLSSEAALQRESLNCPFVSGTCRKTLNRGKIISGVCSVRQATDEASIICCPIRLYDRLHQILLDVAVQVFGEGVRVVWPDRLAAAPQDGKNVVAFGKGHGKELKLPKAKRRGGFYVDWVLARVNANGSLAEFTIVEVQSIDTTGNYHAERAAYMDGLTFQGYSNAGVNWENVSKRILPQLIYKGHVVRREAKCRAGLFFVCPTPVYKRIIERLGADLLEYPRQDPGSITFRWYDLGPEVTTGARRNLVPGGFFTTTVDQLANAFIAPRNLPPANAYGDVIARAINQL